ncbi:hypothetical protein [Spirochaeta dissipatitropha]
MLYELLNTLRESDYANKLNPTFQPETVFSELTAYKKIRSNAFSDITSTEGTSLEHVAKAWQLYTGGNYVASRSAFMHIIKSSTAWRAWALHGCARNELVLGNWRSAGHWVLLSAQAARRENDSIQLAHSYETYAELLLRTDIPLQSLEVFGRAASLGFQDVSHEVRLLIMQACCLGRLGKIVQAQDKFITAFFTPGNPDGSAYALVKGLLSAYLREDTTAVGELTQIADDYPDQYDLTVVNYALKQVLLELTPRNSESLYSRLHSSVEETRVKQVSPVEQAVLSVFVESTHVPEITPEVPVTCEQCSPVDRIYQPDSFTDNIIVEIAKVQNIRSAMKYLNV